MKEIVIPFSGLYESIHRYEIDRALDSMISDSRGDEPVSRCIAEDLWMHIGDTTEGYCKLYLQFFADWFAGNVFPVKFAFVTAQSPRSYNFTTDCIFAKVSDASIRKMFKACDKSILDRIIKARFTSRDGFMSYYEPNRASWGPLARWDHNQLACILSALIESTGRGDWEYEVISDIDSNGAVSNLVYGALDAEGWRLVKIADYLRSREEREYRAGRTAR